MLNEPQNAAEVSTMTEGQYNQVLEKYGKLKEAFLLNINLETVRKYANLLENKIKCELKIVQNERQTSYIGRGGNNVSQNLKKCIFSLLKRILKKPIFQKFQRQCILRHNIKSQKQNIVLIYLYLQKYLNLELIHQREIQQFSYQLKLKIMKYISNSKMKMCYEVKKRQFHQKNAKQFEKYLQFDLDFGKTRAFKEVSQMLRVLFTRKKRQFEKGMKRLKNIIMSDPDFQGLFKDLPLDPQPKEYKKQNQNSDPSPNNADEYDFSFNDYL